MAFNQLTLFVQQAGGFGGPRTSDKSIVPVDAPQRPPDVSVQEQTNIDQVRNALTHIDDISRRLKTTFYALHFKKIFRGVLMFLQSLLTK